MNPKNQIFPDPPQTMSVYMTAGSLPSWEQVPPNCQQELILALVSLVLHLPELQSLLEVQHEPEQ
jgi:hypothetical protein